MREWAEVKAKIETEFAKAKAAKEARPKTQADAAKFFRGQRQREENAKREARRLMDEWIERLKNVRVLDPACGSGNFLYLALKALKDIEFRTNFEFEDLSHLYDVPVGIFVPSVGPECVKGIEINPFAAELARVSVWIGEIQWMREKGFGVSKNPILKPLETIECRDALLNADGTEAEWPEADVIIGNPPFVAARDMVPEIGEAYTDQVREAFAPWIDGGIDFVCYWFVKASKELKSDRVERVGLVCTNSVPRSVSRKAIDLIVKSGHIYNAVSNMLWNTVPARDSTGQFAAVRISIICIDRATPTSFTLDGQAVHGITTDLYKSSPHQQFSHEAICRLKENEAIAFQGIVPRSEIKKKKKTSCVCPTLRSRSVERQGARFLRQQGIQISNQIPMS